MLNKFVGLRVVVIVLILLVGFSCKTHKVIQKKKKLPNKSFKFLSNKVYDNSLEFNTLMIKKLNITFNNNGNKEKFRGILKVQKDSIIWLSILAPLGVPVARFKFTPNKLSFINRLKKEYYEGDYEYISKKLNYDINYYLIQSLLTNSFIDYAQDITEIKRFKSYATENNYILSTYRINKLKRIKTRTEKLKKKNKTNKRLENFIYMKMEIIPESYKIKKIEMLEVAKSKLFEILYNSYSKQGDKLFPKLVEFKIIDDEKFIKCTIKSDKISFDEKLKFKFKIPKKYKKINF